VFTVRWYDALVELPAEAELGRDFWQLLMQVKDEVNRELERRATKAWSARSLSAG
jgi:isoleucyl-tRNA synthetase